MFDIEWLCPIFVTLSEQSIHFNDHILKPNVYTLGALKYSLPTNKETTWLFLKVYEGHFKM